MTINLQSSAPHIKFASHFDFDANSYRQLLTKNNQNLPQAGIQVNEPARVKLEFNNDELRHFVKGSAVYRADNGEVIEANPGTIVHFKQGWRGEVEILSSLRCVFMATAGGSAQSTSVLHDGELITELTDWGSVDEPINGVSKVSGVLLSREADGRAESGIWICTPGSWRCELASDELCHFVKGHSTYTHDNGEIIEIKADTAAFFPKGWSGQCQVHETVRKVYMIR